MQCVLCSAKVDPVCPKCKNTFPTWAVPEGPTDEGGCEFVCPVPTCLSHLYWHCDWEGAGEYRNKIEILS